MKYWNGEELGPVIALDTETEMITEPSMTPRLVITTVSDGKRSFLIKNKDLNTFLYKHKDNILIMHNAPFDLSVISKYLNNRSMYLHAEEDRLWDTRLMYQLIKLAKTGISPQKNNLALLAKEYLDIELDKSESIRCNFGEYLGPEGVNYDNIPTEALEYALKDAEVTFNIWQKLHDEVLYLEQKFGVSNTGLSHKIQLLGAIALDDIQKNGIGFDLDGKKEKLAMIEAEISQHRDVLSKHGWERGKKGIKKIFTEITESMGIKLPKTESGQTATDSDTLQQYRDNPFIEAYLKFHELEKLESFIRDIESDRIYPRYNNLMNTGRTSSFGPNIQQLPRSGGVRELFVPKPGHVYIETDYVALELATLAQHLYTEFNDSSMKDSINAGKDLHKVTATSIYGIKEEEVSKDQRQFSKIANFGLPANMSPTTFVDYCKGYGVSMNIDQATELKTRWASTIPSIKQFWNVGHKDVNILPTGRVRSRCSYTALLNTYFQGLAADGAKLALYLVWKSGYKIVQFVHDSIVIEVLEQDAETATKKVGELMIKGMKFVTPDVEIKVDGRITRSLGK